MSQWSLRAVHILRHIFKQKHSMHLKQIISYNSTVFDFFFERKGSLLDTK